ncbi:class I SAM-dependent methyltransferase [Streptomyces sioyaensis]|uniref:class I SAM-dependent methyltransferase n=1 Tax=Streptomyces sioyaensis TaxID=67364 RepID=UPI0037A9CB8E
MIPLGTIAYGRQFADFYDQVFPKDESADRTATALAALVKEDGTALELGVGTGRIAIPLAQRIGSVVGVDSSPEMLDVLRRDVAQSTAHVVPVHADLCGYVDESEYALVYSVCGTLSMLLDAEQQRQAVRHAADRLAPGGHLVIETHHAAAVLALANGDRTATFFVPYPEPDTGLLTSWTFDTEASLWQASHIWFDHGTVRIGTELSRLTSPEEIGSYTAEAGLEPVGCHADWRGSPFTEKSPMFVGIYRKPEHRR